MTKDNIIKMTIDEAFERIGATLATVFFVISQNSFREEKDKFRIPEKFKKQAMDIYNATREWPHINGATLKKLCINQYGGMDANKFCQLVTTHENFKDHKENYDLMHKTIFLALDNREKDLKSSKYANSEAWETMKKNISK